MSEYGGRLFDQHAAMLAASKITPEHARARGYVTVDTKKRLEPIGITKTGRNVPGLLVPQLRKDGSTWGWQYRPDVPRVRNDKPVKYETPYGQHNGIDVPPGVGPQLDDPSIPLWITEGVRKADAAACAGLACIAVPGVWSWKGTNSSGGKVAVADWNDIALNGRRVILAFDSDVVIKESVQGALRALAGYLQYKGASVEYCHLPDAGDGKTGLDDYLADGHTVDDLRRLVRPDPPAVTESAPDAAVAPDAPDTGEGSTAPRDPKIDGDELLTRVRDWLGTYISTAVDSDLDLLALWAVHTHLVVETYTTPRLVIDSPVHDSGKTTVMDHLKRLSKSATLMATVSSAAMLPRMLEIEMRTILIDEADRALDPKKEGVNDLLAVLNSGYRRGGTRPVLVPGTGGKWDAKEMPTFAPVAMAGNNPRLPNDTRSRSIRMVLLPDRSGLIKESNWRKIESEAIALHDDIAAWADQVRGQVEQHEPDLPDGIRGRLREKWAPLKAVADSAGSDWPKRVDLMAERDRKEIAMDKEDGLVTDKPSVALLRHIHEVWPTTVPFLATENLITRLINEYPGTWGPMSGKTLTAKRLGFLLADSYKIQSDREGRGTPRGYFLAPFIKPWTAMGVGQPEPDDDEPDDDEPDDDEPDAPGAPLAPDQGRGYEGEPDQVDPLSQSGASGASGSSGVGETGESVNVRAGIREAVRKAYERKASA